MDDAENRDSTRTMSPATAVVAGSVALAAASALTGPVAVATAALGGTLLPFGLYAAFRGKPSGPPPSDWPENDESHRNSEPPPAIGRPPETTPPGRRWIDRTTAGVASERGRR